MNRAERRNSAKVSLLFDSVVIVGIFYSAWTLWWLPEQLWDTVGATSARAGLATLLLIPALSIAALFRRPASRTFARTPAIVTRYPPRPASRRRN